MSVLNASWASEGPSHPLAREKHLLGLTLVPRWDLDGRERLECQKKKFGWQIAEMGLDARLWHHVYVVCYEQVKLELRKSHFRMVQYFLTLSQQPGG